MDDKPIEMVRIGPLELPRFGDVTVGEDIALAKEDLAIAQAVEKGNLISQKEYNYRRALVFAKIRGKYPGSTEELAEKLSRNQAEKLVKFLEEELAGIPPAEEENQPIPLAKSKNSIGESGLNSATTSQEGSQEIVFIPSD